MSSPKIILFVTYGGGHAQMICPVVQELRRSSAFARNEISIHVLALPAAGQTVRGNGIDCFGFKDFLDPQKDADALEWGRSLAAKHHSSTVGIPLEDSIAYLGLCYKDLVMRYGDVQAAQLLVEKGRQAFLPLTVMTRVFDRLRPDFVVTSNSPRSEAAAIETANRRRINSLIMTDLFTGLGDYQLRAKHITFLNETAREMFVADGLADDAVSQFHCTGNPAFDRLLMLPNQGSPAWMVQHFPQLGTRKAVLHADMPAYWDGINRCSHFKSEEETLAELDACYQACRANDVAYLVRPHPSQDRSFYEHWLLGKPHAYLAAECNLHELLANVDLLLARTTTVGLEAAIMRKRILQLDSERHQDLPIAQMGVAWGSCGYESLSREICNALGDNAKYGDIKARIDKMFPPALAAPKVASIILQELRLI